MGLNSVTPKYSAIGGGSSILFAGNGFISSNITGANIDGVPCTSFVRIDDFQITANSPAHAFTDTPLDSFIAINSPPSVLTLAASFYYIKAPFVSTQVNEGINIFGLSGTLSAVVLTNVFETFNTFFLAGGTLNWTKISGPGSVAFGSPTLKDTTFTVSLKGTYVIRCTVNNSLGGSAVDLTVNMHGLPVVNAGIDGSCLQLNGYNLVGSANDL